MFWLQVEENHFPQSLGPHFPLLKKDAPRKDFLTQKEFDKVLMRKNGQRMKDFRRAWDAATEKAGLAGRKFHGLRRRMATRLMASGIDSQTARMITGHKDAATFEQYRQLRRTVMLQAGRKLEKAQRAK